MTRKLAYATAFLLATALPACGQQVTFTCAITGSGADGFDIVAVNSGPDRKQCRATCTVTKNDGSTQSWSYSGVVRAGAPNQRQWFAGEAGLKGAPLKDPTISTSTCE
jgi:hypothetical protein